MTDNPEARTYATVLSELSMTQHELEKLRKAHADLLISDDETRRSHVRLARALMAMLPENCTLGDDPSGKMRPSFSKCEEARAALREMPTIDWISKPVRGDVSCLDAVEIVERRQ